MARPLKCRLIAQEPDIEYFKPRGIPLIELEEVNLTLDEFEAIRLADLNGSYQEDAARQMKISRATFGNILMNAHKKIAEALINGKAIRIEGGMYNMKTQNRLRRRAGCQRSLHQTRATAAATGGAESNQDSRQDLNWERKPRARQRRCQRRGK